MAERSTVPKFGNWENGEKVPYTVFFEKARKGRGGGRMINPNDPQEYLDDFSNAASPPQALPSKTRAEPEELPGQGAFRPTHVCRVSREGGHVMQVTDSPARNANMDCRGVGDSMQQHNGGPGVNSGENRKPTKQGTGSEPGVNRSPLHPHYQGRTMGKGSAFSSPTREGKSTHEISHGTPGRSRLKPAIRSNDSLDKGGTVPKFGEWDEGNPSSADGYTHIFDQMRAQRQAGGTELPGMAHESCNGNIWKPNTGGSDKLQCCCFPWVRK